MNPGTGGRVSRVDSGDCFGAHERTGADTTRHDALRRQSLVGDRHGVPRHVEATRQLPRGWQLLARAKATVQHSVE
jgi:hypothetical protein